MGLDLSLYGFKLVHQSLVNMKSAGGIYDNIVVTVLLGVIDRCLCYLDGIGLTHLKDGHADLLADDLQLLDSSRTIDIAGNEHRAVILIFKHKCELRTVSSLT